MEIKTKEKKIVIPRIKKEIATITIKGITPLLVNKFSEKAKTEIQEKQAKTAKNVKGARNPQLEYESAMYVLEKKGKVLRTGIPASGLKLAAVSACRCVDGLKMTQVTAAFHVLDDGMDLIEVKNSKGKPAIPEIDERPVKIGPFGKKVTTIRYRPIYNDWMCTFRVIYNPDMISPDQLVNLYSNAGFSVGLCEHRPERKGKLGMFEVVTN